MSDDKIMKDDSLKKKEEFLEEGDRKQDSDAVLLNRKTKRDLSKGSKKVAIDSKKNFKELTKLAKVDMKKNNIKEISEKKLKSYKEFKQNLRDLIKKPESVDVAKLSANFKVTFDEAKSIAEMVTEYNTEAISTFIPGVNGANLPFHIYTKTAVNGAVSEPSSEDTDMTCFTLSNNLYHLYGQFHQDVLRSEDLGDGAPGMDKDLPSFYEDLEIKSVKYIFEFDSTRNMAYSRIHTIPVNFTDIAQIPIVGHKFGFFFRTSAGLDDYRDLSCSLLRTDKINVEGKEVHVSQCIITNKNYQNQKHRVAFVQKELVLQTSADFEKYILGDFPDLTIDPIFLEKRKSFELTDKMLLPINNYAGYTITGMTNDTMAKVVETLGSTSSFFEIEIKPEFFGKVVNLVRIPSGVPYVVHKVYSCKFRSLEPFGEFYEGTGRVGMIMQSLVRVHGIQFVKLLWNLLFKKIQWSASDVKQLYKPMANLMANLKVYNTVFGSLEALQHEFIKFVMETNGPLETEITKLSHLERLQKNCARMIQLQNNLIMQNGILVDPANELPTIGAVVKAFDTLDGLIQDGSIKSMLGIIRVAYGDLFERLGSNHNVIRSIPIDSKGFTKMFRDIKIYLANAPNRFGFLYPLGEGNFMDVDFYIPANLEAIIDVVNRTTISFNEILVLLGLTNLPAFIELLETKVRNITREKDAIGVRLETDSEDIALLSRFQRLASSVRIYQKVIDATRQASNDAIEQVRSEIKRIGNKPTSAELQDLLTGMENFTFNKVVEQATKQLNILLDSEFKIVDDIIELKKDMVKDPIPKFISGSVKAGDGELVLELNPNDGVGAEVRKRVLIDSIATMNTADAEFAEDMKYYESEVLLDIKNFKMDDGFDFVSQGISRSEFAGLDAAFRTAFGINRVIPNLDKNINDPRTLKYFKALTRIDSNDSLEILLKNLGYDTSVPIEKFFTNNKNYKLYWSQLLDIGVSGTEDLNLNFIQGSKRKTKVPRRRLAKAPPKNP